MSPEHVRGEAADAPSDIFAFGCVLYEMLTGQCPFARATAAETIAAILRDDPSPLSQTGKDTPEGLERVLRRCLKKRPHDRFQSAQDLGGDLRTMLTGARIPASVPMPERPNRNATWVFSVIASTLLLGIWAWLYLPLGRTQPIDSLAILPLTNGSGDVDAEYLSDGITESLINSFSQLPNLRVMARSTVFSYKDKQFDPRQSGQEMGVRAVLTGRVIQRNDSLVIQAELINVADGSRLWAERYTRKPSDILKLQDEIAQQISQILHLKLTRIQQKQFTKRYTDNVEAHQLYLKGRYYLGESGEERVRKGLEYFRQALELDPNYALAYAGQADAYYDFSNVYWPPKEALPKSRAAALKALELDETLAEAHNALAAVKSAYDWDWPAAEREYKRAIELNPAYARARNFYGLFLVAMGRFDEALLQMQQAQRLDPLSPYVHVGTVWPVYFARQYDAAIEQLNKIILRDPDFPYAHLNLGWAYAQSGMHEKAISALTRAKSLDDTWVNSAYLGYVYAKAGKLDEARKLLTELQKRAAREYVSHYGLAIVHVGLGENDRAFASLQNAYEERDEQLVLLKVEPFFDALRSDPRFKELLRRLNFGL
jgi:serine/threonine-protein kinase